MAKPRKKASKKASKKKASKKKNGSGRVTVSRSALNRVISLGASHHADIAKLKRTVGPVKKAAKKRAKRRKKP